MFRCKLFLGAWHGLHQIHYVRCELPLPVTVGSKGEARGSSQNSGRGMARIPCVFPIQEFPTFFKLSVSWPPNEIVSRCFQPRRKNHPTLRNSSALSLVIGQAGWIEAIINAMKSHGDDEDVQWPCRWIKLIKQHNLEAPHRVWCYCFLERITCRIHKSYFGQNPWFCATKTNYNPIWNPGKSTPLKKGRSFDWGPFHECCWPFLPRWINWWFRTPKLGTCFNRWSPTKK